MSHPGEHALLMDRRPVTVRVLIIHPSLPYILAVTRRGDPNDFGLPGGHVKDRELPDTTARREVLEEVGVTVAALVPVYEDIRRPRSYETTQVLWAAEGWTGVPRAVEKGSTVAWVAPARLRLGKYAWFNGRLLDALDLHGFGAWLVARQSP